MSDAGGLFHFFRLAGGDIENAKFRPSPTRRNCLRPAASAFSKTGGSARPSFLICVGKGRQANRIHDFKWAQLPGKTPAHGAIDVDDVIGNFRHATPGVQAHFRKAAPDKLLGLVGFLSLEKRRQQAHANARACLRWFCPPRCEANFAFWRARYSIVFSIQCENFLFALAALHALVKALAGFIAQPFALWPFLRQARELCRFRATHR